MNEPSAFTSRNEKAHPFDLLISKMKYPLPTLLGGGLLFIYLLGFIFNRGLQIYPIDNKVPDDMYCPECRVLSDIKQQITERQFRVTYKISAHFPITKTNAWRLLRIIVRGKYYTEEMRAEDNCGTYVIGKDVHVIHWELTQEGQTDVQLLCLDDKYEVSKSKVTPWNGRIVKNTIFHESKGISNICFENSKAIFFTRSTIRNYTKDFFLTNYEHKRQDITSYASKIKMIRTGYLIDSTNSERNTNDIISNIIFPSYFKSIEGHTISFRSGKDSKKYSSIIKNINEKLYYEHQSLSCWNDLSFEFDPSKMINIKNDGLKSLRSLLMKSDKKGTGVIIPEKVNPINNIKKINNAVVFDNDDYMDKIVNYSQSMAMISFDDQNEVGNALWLQDDSPLLLLRFGKEPEEDNILMKLIKRSGRKIIPIEIDPKKCTSKNAEHMEKCVTGAKNKLSDECIAVFQSIKCDLPYNVINDHINQTLHN